MPSRRFGFCSMLRRAVALLAALVISSPRCWSADAFIVGAFKRVEKDFRSLTRRVTARHILVPDEEIAVALKRKIRDECVTKDLWVIDVFEEAARKYSRDETTNFRGGLIGELVPQGYCRSPELDRLQFSVALGEIVGPLETDFGFHLLLVSERTNCPQLDGDKTRMMRTRGDDVFGTLAEGSQAGRVNAGELIADQVKFWCFAFLAGGILAELSERLVSGL